MTRHSPLPLVGVGYASSFAGCLTLLTLLINTAEREEPVWFALNDPHDPALGQPA